MILVSVHQSSLVIVDGWTAKILTWAAGLDV